MNIECEPTQIGIGMIGCGLRLRTVLRPDPIISVNALCDIHCDSIKAALCEYNENARIYERYQDLVNDPMVDWVAIGSWNCEHKNHAVAALKAGKHVFCEKPLATSLEDCLSIREAVRESGKTFSYGLVLRYSLFYRKIKEILESGAIGNIVSFEFNETIPFNHGGYIFGNWRRFQANGGTHLLEKCCHDIDLANWMTDSLPVRVASFGGLNFFRPENSDRIDQIGPDAQGREAYRAWPGLEQVNPFTSEKDIFDNQVVILEYENGVRASFHTNCNAGIPERRFYICGSRGALRADAVTGVIECQKIGHDSSSQRIQIDVADGHAGGDRILRESVYRSMENGTPPLVGIDEAIESAVVCFAIDRAQSERRVVDLESLWNRVGIRFG